MLSNAKPRFESKQKYNEIRETDVFKTKTSEIYNKEKQIFEDLAKNELRVRPMFDYVVGENKGNIVHRPLKSKAQKLPATNSLQSPSKVMANEAIPNNGYQIGYNRSKIYTESDLNEIVKRVEEKKKQDPNAATYITDKELNDVIDQYYQQKTKKIPSTKRVKNHPLSEIPSDYQKTDGHQSGYVGQSPHDIIQTLSTSKLHYTLGLCVIG